MSEGDFPSKVPLKIEWRLAPFPSSQLTLGQLRQALNCDHEEMGVLVHNLALLEEERIKTIFHGALGLGGEDEALFFELAKDDTTAELTELYISTGLVSGQMAAAELLRQLDSWAVSKARKHVPDKPR